MKALLSTIAIVAACSVRIDLHHAVGEPQPGEIEPAQNHVATDERDVIQLVGSVGHRDAI